MFEFKELLDIRIAIKEKCEYYGTELIHLENVNYEGNYYKIVKNEYNEHKRLFDKIENIIKNFDNIKKN